MKVSSPYSSMPDSTPPPAAPQLTLLEVKNHLFVHFLVKTTFSLAEDLISIKLGTSFDDPKGKFHAYKAALIVTALDEMVKQGLLLVLDVTHGTYMLTQPLGTFTQTVQISPYTAHLVTEAFNFFSRATNSDYVANKLAVTDSEIQGLALITFSLRDQIDGMHAQIEELENMMELDGEGGDGGPDKDGGNWPSLGANTPGNN